MFVTTDLSLRPGLVALLDALRWKIEKAYDVFKNKLHQRKAWANGRTAAHAQAHLIALTHNLLTILLCHLESTGLKEVKVRSRAETLRLKTPAPQQVPSRNMVRHAHQLTCQFIRLVRHCLDHQTRWREALPLFERRLACYL